MRHIIENNIPYGDVSDKYIPTSTQEIIDAMGKDFKVVDFKASRVRKEEKEGKQRHVVMLEANDAHMIDGTNMRVVLYNSLDKTTGIRLNLGAFRAVCENGLIWGESFMQEIRIRHTYKHWESRVEQLMNEYDKRQYEATEMIDSMMNTYLSRDAQSHITREVANSIYSGTGIIVDHNEFNVARRIDDTGNDLWHTYQRVQENLIRGGVKRVLDGELCNTYGVRNQDEMIRVNKQLHNLCLEMM